MSPSGTITATRGSVSEVNTNAKKDSFSAAPLFLRSGNRSNLDNTATLQALLGEQRSCQLGKDFMFNDPLLKLMSVSLVTSEGSLPLTHHHLQHFYHQHLLHQQQAAATAAMLVHNGRLPGGSPVPVPSPNSSVSHPESPRSQAAESTTATTPPATVGDNEGNVGKSTGKKEDPEDEIVMEEDDNDDEVLSIGGKDDEQMMMDCDSSVSDGVRTEKDREGRDHEVKINGEEDYFHDEDSPRKHNYLKDQTPPARCPSASTTAASIPDEPIGTDEDDVNSEADSQGSSSNVSSKGKRSKSHQHFSSNNPKADSRSHKYHPFNISNLSSNSPPALMEDESLYNRHIINPHAAAGIPNNYFLHHNHFFHHHHHQLLNDTNSNHSTASSTNNSSPSPSSAFHHHQQQQQTAAVAAAHSLIFSIANILRPDFGLCNNNNNNNNHISNGISSSPKGITTGPSSHHHHFSAMHGFGARRHSGGGSSKQNHYNGNSPTSSYNASTKHNHHQSRSGHRESSSASTATTTIPIDLSRPISNGSATMMISPNSTLSMMDNAGRGGTNPSKSRHNHKNISKSDKHPHSQPHPAEKYKKQSEKPPRAVTPSSSANHSVGLNGNSNTSTGNNNKANKAGGAAAKEDKNLWPAWVYCTRYSDRPSSGPRTRRTKKKEKEVDEKRPRTAFTAEQLSRLKKEFDENRYLTEKRRQDLARELKLHENQIKIWFQNKRAKLKKSTGQRGGLAIQLMAQGLYNHSTIPPRGPDDDSDLDDDDDEC